MNRNLGCGIGVLCGLVTILWPCAVVVGQAAQTAVGKGDLTWFREAKFGLFIHWGLYAVPAGQWKGEDYPWIGEWIMNWAKIPTGEYEQLAAQFNPVKFDADSFAQLAKDAGMRYLVITAKHHDGFAMFDSKATTYDIVDATPFKRDPLKELQGACEKHGLKYGFYYSQAQDWHEPHAAGNTWQFTTPHEKRDPQEYLRRKAMPQVRELLTGYGPLGLIWFDTPVLLTREHVIELERLVRDKQPQCLINSRLGHGLGDYEQMGDNMVPSDVYPEDWEIPATLNDTWGYKIKDKHWKPAEYLIYRLVDVVSKGGNYLLNVGPRADGTIPSESIERLREIGRWLSRHGESIYGTTHSPFSVGDQAWRCTAKAETLYFHLLRWPAGGRFRIEGLRNEVTAAFLLSDPNRQPLKAWREGAVLFVDLPGDMPDPYCPVLAVVISGEPDVEPAMRWDAPRTVITLTARESSPHGPYVRYSEFEQSVSGFAESHDKMLWHLLIRQPSRFDVEVEYAAENHETGREMRFHAFRQELRARVEDTAGRFDWRPLGVLEVTKAGLEETRLHLQDPGPSATIRV
ncbi:MAG: alpha-L-fucosidase, partial [Planctomycetes bacterium]|nr:alpha-L-fucosidase [Planctomycetota bacterium]